MKKLYFFVFVLFYTAQIAFAQVPKLMNYQGVARDVNNQPLPNRAISLKLSVLDNISSTTPLYSEILSTSTNAMGLFTVKIGSGTPTVGNINSVNWTDGIRYLKTEIDINGGTTFIAAGLPVQFVAVPYALVADTALRSPRVPTYTAGAGITIQNGVIANSAPNQTVGLTGSNGVSVTGTYPNFTISGSSSSGGQIIIMNAANAATLALTAPSIVRVDGTITLASNNSQLTTSTNNQIFGGTFQGSGSQILYTNTNTKFYGVNFNNISVDVNTSGGNTDFNSNVIFENCAFAGNITKLPSQALFVNCTFTNAIVGNANYLGWFVKCKIIGTTIPLLLGISQSNISSSTIGNTGGFGQIGFLTENNISATQLYLYDDCRVIGNQFAEVKLQIGGSGVNSNTPRTLSISNNFFGYGDPNFTDPIINFDLSSSIRAKSYVISNNQFLITNSSLNLNAILDF